MKAVFLDYASLDQNDLDFQALHAVFDELILYPSTDAETLVARVQDADVIISNKVMVDADTLKQCSQLKLILISATGTNNIDLQQAKAQGVVNNRSAQVRPPRCVLRTGGPSGKLTACCGCWCWCGCWCGALGVPAVQAGHAISAHAGAAVVGAAWRPLRSDLWSVRPVGGRRQR